MIEIEILDEDERLIVINKPRGLSVHNGPENLIDVLADGLGQRFKPVHRLDRETSGVILLAKSKLAAAELQGDMLDPATRKVYTAIVKGQPKVEAGDWRQSISPKAEGRRNPRGTSKDRVDAHTRFRVLAKTQWISKLECQLLTGRQHQIRKHAALAGCHVIGDRRYGEPKHAKMIEKRYAFEGLALHAMLLNIRIGGRNRVFRAKPPKDWALFGL